MKNLLTLIITLIFLLSCKKENKRISLVKEKSQIQSEVSSKEIEQNDLGYYNEMGTLGIGLIKPLTDSLIFYKKNIKTKQEIVSSFNPFPITPVFYKPDYGIVYLICLEDTKEYYKIKSIDGVFYLKKANYVFVDWKTFLMNSTGINNIDGKTNPIKKENSAKSEDLDWSESEEIIIIDVKKDWILIQNEYEQIGWIKWKIKNKLLIEIYLLI
ncbi:hypothetical protein [Tenacibaculum finnmarkense]|uniref:hypothetical protein n=1 Tax=Tenacibaculum finnmarkense TaxID=2781243 RepID=UPI000C640705|nr:hypothetical protein [Tenacibaculum finnmarkense]MCD8440810.1 hypothetical protein [Tenacibaculum finnmarkense genomovar ulcerans]MCG8721721.1 hypothetical protein [Tenacibaculum finnmarkense]SOS55837.1 conserved hypothetical protein [Tenacibaculum finnmarkense]